MCVCHLCIKELLTYLVTIRSIFTVNVKFIAVAIITITKVIFD